MCIYHVPESQSGGRMKNNLISGRIAVCQREKEQQISKHLQLSKFLKIRKSSKFRSLIELQRDTIGGNREKAWPSGVVLNIMQTIANCQCKPLANTGDVQVTCTIYLEKYFFKYNIRLENHLLIHTCSITLALLSFGHVIGHAP